ncbi:hypothetical protein GGR50DRAFT_691110 [Xylaria sp. CBS 124048]|nr:hypothetical protein GGR50DRAFT_691110 [Xylaria sp. CBS 124048]
MSRNLTTWGGKVHEDILVAISSAAQLSRGDWDKIMQYLHSMGHTFTESALKQHLQKLKRNGNGSAAGSNPATPTKPTPKKRSPKKKSDLANKKRAADAMGDGDDGDDEEAAKPAIKKLKLEKPAVTVKEEVDDEAQDGEI